MPSSAVQTCALDRKSTRLNSSHTIISYAVFCLQKNADRLEAQRPPPPHPRPAKADREPVRDTGRPEADSARPTAPTRLARARPLLFFYNLAHPPDFDPLPLPAAPPT